MMIYRHSGILTTLVCMGWLLSGCAGSGPLPPVEEARRDPPAEYIVVRGDTLYGIAWRYGLDYRQVADWNRLANPDLIYPGQRIRLRPSHAKSQAQDHPSVAFQGQSIREIPEPPPATASVNDSPNRFPEPRQETGSATKTPDQLASISPQTGRRTSDSERKVGERVWRWPAEGEIMRSYQPNVPGRKGIHIGGQLGQTVRAASPGQVVYSGNGLPGYGRLIIVKHSDTLLSAYGYLGSVFVREGDSVGIGQPIAEMGANSENHPALHFEIRQNGKPVDPLQFLPG